MHLIPGLLEFTLSVSDFVGDYELLTNPDEWMSVCKFIGDCVAFAVNIFQLSVKCRRTVVRL
jgi:hypothetical protein